MRQARLPRGLQTLRRGVSFMQEFLLAHYQWLRAIHIISVIAWMAGLGGTYTVPRGEIARVTGLGHLDADPGVRSSSSKNL